MTLEWALNCVRPAVLCGSVAEARHAGGSKKGTKGGSRLGDGEELAGSSKRSREEVVEEERSKKSKRHEKVGEGGKDRKSDKKDRDRSRSRDKGSKAAKRGKERKRSRSRSRSRDRR